MDMMIVRLCTTEDFQVFDKTNMIDQSIILNALDRPIVHSAPSGIALL